MSLIKEEDLNVLREVADKYNMNLNELGFALRNIKTSTAVVKHIRFKASELIVIDSKTDNRSAFCIESALWYIRSGEYKNFDIYDLKKKKKSGDNGEDTRVGIYIKNELEYDEIFKVCKDMNVPFSTFVKYCALKFEKIERE